MHESDSFDATSSRLKLAIYSQDLCKMFNGSQRITGNETLDRSCCTNFPIIFHTGTLWFGGNRYGSCVLESGLVTICRPSKPSYCIGYSTFCIRRPCYSSSPLTSSLSTYYSSENIWFMDSATWTCLG